MKLERLRFSKCPHCHRYGIPAFGKLYYRYPDPISTCNYCGKSFRVRFWFSLILKLGDHIALPLVCAAMNVPLWAILILCFSFFGVFERLAPLKKANEEE